MGTKIELTDLARDAIYNKVNLIADEKQDKLNFVKEDEDKIDIGNSKSVIRVEETFTPPEDPGELLDPMLSDKSYLYLKENKDVELVSNNTLKLYSDSDISLYPNKNSTIYMSNAKININYDTVTIKGGYDCLKLQIAQTLDRYVDISFYKQDNTRIGYIRGMKDGYLDIGAFTKISMPGETYPSTDNSANLGTSSKRWKQLYAGTTTISTSDERQKQDIDVIDERLFRAWEKVNFVQYRFKDAVNEKGDKARIHFGVIAQKIKEAFESEGLDGFKYGLLCYDEWEDEYVDEDVIDEKGIIHTEKKLVRKAGYAYGVRYSEVLALECAYQRWMLDKLKKLIKVDIDFQ